jgi:hypothetical protein
MRELTDHIVSGDQAVQLKIEVLDEPGADGANHEYRIDWYDSVKRDSGGYPIGPRAECQISFQNGPIKEFGVNGVTNEAFAAIIIDRLRSFQAGPFASDQNQAALESFEMGLFSLQERTRLRIARGVEGTHQQ